MNKSRVTFRILFFALLVILLGLLCLIQLLNAENALDMGVNVLTLLILSILIYSVAHHSSHADALITKLDAAEPPVHTNATNDNRNAGMSQILSDQLKRPVKAILGHIALFKDGTYGKLSESAVVPIQLMDASAKQIAEFADDMLLLSDIENKTLKLEPSIFSLKVLGAKIVDEQRSRSIKKGLLLLFRSDTETDMLVRADVEKVKRIIHILVDNAQKYTKKGDITVVAHDDVKAKRAYLSVKDSGIGMTKDIKSSIFQKFYRADTVSDTIGTGLGLYIAKQLIIHMGGKIKAESKGEGKGSLFTLELPLAK